MQKLLLIDGNSILNRAFYAVPILTNKNGVYTNAVYGFLNIVSKIIDEENPTHLLVCFDVKAKTFRHNMFEDYKGTRSSMPEELRPQLQTIKDVLASMNIQTYEKEGFEADDLLGTLAIKAEKEGFYPVILSGDKDLLQLASEKIKIKIPKTSKGSTVVKDYFANDVLEEFSVTPKEYIELKGLMGDTSDNVPGVPGVGIKTATKIINEFKSIENAIENADKVTPKKAKENLIEFKDQALLSKVLVTIEIDAPIDFVADDVIIRDVYNSEAFELFKELELKTYFSRFEKSMIDSKPKKEVLFEVIDNPFEGQDAIATILKGEHIAFQIYTEDESLIAMSFAIDEDKVYIFDKFEGMIDLCSEIFESNNKKISYDLKNDFAFLEKRGIKLNNVVMGLSVCGYILKPTSNNYDYDTLSLEYLDEYQKPLDEILLKGKSKKSVNSLTYDEKFGLFATMTNVYYRVFFVFEKLIKEQDKENLLYNIEMPLSILLHDMEKEGITVNKEALQEFSKKLSISIKEVEEKILDLAGEEFNINSPSQLGVILFEKLGLVATKKTKTGYSTANEVLEKLIDKHDIIEQIITYRSLAKLKSTYAEGLLSVVCLDSKIHSTFNQTVTATGRISSTEPNLQNIPTRLPLGRELRKVFVPKSEDYVFLDADYNQIELRVLAHLSGDEILINAFKENIDIHKLTASEVFHIPFDEVTSRQRSNAKAVNFGIVYGMGAFSLSQDLGITKKEADRYIEGYFKKYPKVHEYLESLITFARENGYSKTLLNRTREIKEINDSNFNKRSFAERIAMNMPIQGTSADIIKIAMVNVYNRLKEENLDAKIILQVHDELLIEVNKKDLEKTKNILESEMQNAIELSVPLIVSLSDGNDWFSLK